MSDEELFPEARVRPSRRRAAAGIDLGLTEHECHRCGRPVPEWIAAVERVKNRQGETRWFHQRCWAAVHGRKVRPPDRGDAAGLR
jgi:hypothetical protein